MLKYFILQKAKCLNFRFSSNQFRYDPSKNYYAILGVPRNATTDEVKQKFYSMAKMCHPDVNPNQGQLFKLISEAYMILTNPENRKAYDNDTNPFRQNQKIQNQDDDYQRDMRMYQQQQQSHFYRRNQDQFTYEDYLNEKKQQQAQQRQEAHQRRQTHPGWTPQKKYQFGQDYTEYLKNEQNWISQKVNEKRQKGEPDYQEKPQFNFGDIFDMFDKKK